MKNMLSRFALLVVCAFPVTGFAEISSVKCRFFNLAGTADLTVNESQSEIAGASGTESVGAFTADKQGAFTRLEFSYRSPVLHNQRVQIQVLLVDAPLPGGGLGGYNSAGVLYSQVSAIGFLPSGPFSSSGSGWLPMPAMPQAIPIGYVPLAYAHCGLY